MAILREHIHDNRFLRLIEELLTAGYCEAWTYHPTHSGTPQGGVVSPILANISLDRFDRFVEHTRIPEYTRGTVRKRHPEHVRLGACASYYRRTGRPEFAEQRRRKMQDYPGIDPTDPGYRRLRYVRYADDW